MFLVDLSVSLVYIVYVLYIQLLKMKIDIAHSVIFNLKEQNINTDGMRCDNSLFLIVYYIILSLSEQTTLKFMNHIFFFKTIWRVLMAAIHCV